MDEIKKDPPLEESKQGIVSWIVVIAIVLFVYGGFLLYAYYDSEPMRDCDYSDTGCQGETSRFGQ